jgi:chromate transporter
MRERTVGEVFLTFLKLGVMSFGGPLAHIGYLREELVVRRRWVDDTAYTDLLALCQFLPGPTSSQLGCSLGLIRAGYGGGLAAWLGFTLPSAILMTAFAFGAGVMGRPVGAGLLHGLMLVAVAIVAQAVWGMARTLCPDRQRAAIGMLVMVVVLVLGSNSSWSQVGVMLLGAVLGLWLCRDQAAGVAAPVGESLGSPVSPAAGFTALGAFLLLLAGLPLLARATSSTTVGLFAAIYRCGALVFGGGHVVLPLLRDAVVAPGWVSNRLFLAGYGAAQAVPGPLFAFAGYLGAVADPVPHGVMGAALALVAIFLPGMLILVGTLPFWDSLRTRGDAQAIMRGVNAAVVGLLGAALYTPVWLNAVANARDAGVAIAGFVLLTVWRTPPIGVVVAGAVSGIVLRSTT